MRDDFAFTPREMFAQLPLAFAMFLLTVLTDEIHEGGMRMPAYPLTKAFVLSLTFAGVLAFRARRSARLARLERKGDGQAEARFSAHGRQP